MVFGLLVVLLNRRKNTVPENFSQSTACRNAWKDRNFRKRWWKVDRGDVSKIRFLGRRKRSSKIEKQIFGLGFYEIAWLCSSLMRPHQGKIYFNLENASTQPWKKNICIRGFEKRILWHKDMRGNDWIYWKNL